MALKQGMSDADLTDATANGKDKIPAYKGKLTDQQIINRSKSLLAILGR